jgi:hypothetical protein
MKFLVLSDLHLEFGVYQPDPHPPQFDAVILAGDIMPGAHLVPSWAQKPWLFGPDKPIVVVAGNHEFYGGGAIQLERGRMQEVRLQNVHVLDPGEVLLDEGRVRVLGCTLWTDFRLSVRTPDGPLSNQQRAMDEAALYMVDYSVIGFRAPGAERRRLTPADTLALHQEERGWLLAKLKEPFHGTTVVVTHHGPSYGSVAERWADDWLTPSFVSNLPDEYFEVPVLWVHGHTHSSFDYVRGCTRVVCNPRGYRMRDGTFENRAFNPRLVIDTEAH